VGHTKESNAETFRISKSDLSIILHEEKSFPLFHTMIVFFRNKKSGINVLSEGKSKRFQNKAADKNSIFFPWIITN